MTKTGGDAAHEETLEAQPREEGVVAQEAMVGEERMFRRVKIHGDRCALSSQEDGVGLERIVTFHMTLPSLQMDPDSDLLFFCIILFLSPFLLDSLHTFLLSQLRDVFCSP